MKKLLTMLLALAMLLGCTALAETVTAVDYTGVWTLTGVEMMGVTVDPTQLGMEMSIAIYEGGACEMLMTGEDAEQGTWAAIEGGVAVTDASSVTMNLLLREDGALIMEQSGMKMIFTGEDAAPAAAAEPALAVDADIDYTGWWTLTGIEMMGVTMDPTQLSMNMSIVLYEDGYCEILMTGEDTEQGAWAKIEGGVAVTDASDVTMNLMLRADGTLAMEQSGMTMVFTAETYSMPLAGLTLADFEGAWSLSYVEYMGQFAEAAELGMEIDVTIAEGKGQMVITDETGTVSSGGVCELAEEEGFGSVLYLMFTDPATGEQDGSGVMLMKFSAEELVWYTWDETENDIFYFFVPAEI